MINQNRNTASQQQTTTAKLGMSNCLKIKRQQISPKSNQFVNDMKKLGIIKDIQEVSQMNQLLSENSPIRSQQDIEQTNRQTLLKQKPTYQRNHSPPPTFSNNNITNIQRITIKQENKEKQSTQQDQNEVVQNEEGDKTVFQFPFQRRARSVSLTKQNEEGNKKEKSKSPSPVANGEDNKRNKPILAKTNFVIAHKAILQKHLKQDEDTFERNKEVEEWLMGSGESAATAGSNTSKKQQELEKPIQPLMQDELDLIEEDDEEDWMFKTVNNNKNSTARIAQINQPTRSRMVDQQNNLDFESPFDIAPEMMSKQFSNKQQSKQDCFIFDDLECDELNQYIQNIDAEFENKYLI